LFLRMKNFPTTLWVIWFQQPTGCLCQSHQRRGC